MVHYSWLSNDDLDGAAASGLPNNWPANNPLLMFYYFVIVLLVFFFVTED